MTSAIYCQQQCNSLVFFDLETTGLPNFQNPRITELSFCAIDRSTFLQGTPKNIPRVTNRLNLCIYPSRPIDLVASEMTLLYTDMLECQSPFNHDVANIISSFLNRLNKPICLIAHNGIQFDFPIFKSEMNRLGEKAPDGMLCADSLPIFKGLEESTEMIKSQSPPVMANSSLEINPFNFMNENKSRLTTDLKQQQKPKSPSIRFNLENVYQRIYGESPQVTHNAEADVFTLLLAAIATPVDFVSRVEHAAIPFETIKKCW